MPNKIKRGPSNDRYFKSYELQDRKEKNKVIAIERHKKQRPNDKEAGKREIPDYGPGWKRNSKKKVDK